jgi:hypothetical protein
MHKFIALNMPGLATEARAKFDEYKDLLYGFATGAMAYEEFAGRMLRRSRGEPEDFDEGQPFPDYDY